MGTIIQVETCGLKPALSDSSPVFCGPGRSYQEAVSIAGKARVAGVQAIG